MPELVIIGGPNGAGKTTIAFKVLPDFFADYDFVNADIIAKGLSAFNTSSVDFEAGRIMLKRLKELRSSGRNFSFETTLSSKSFVPFLKECKSAGYKITIIYVWLKDYALAIDRVSSRKNEGGHYIPDEIIKRRYTRSRNNLIDFYLPLADEWKFYDNSENKTRLIAEKRTDSPEKIFDNNFYTDLMTREIKEPIQEYAGDRLDQLVEAAIREELERKHKLNLPIVFMHEGKIVKIEGKDLYKYLNKDK